MQGLVFMRAQPIQLGDYGECRMEIWRNRDTRNTVVMFYKNGHLIEKGESDGLGYQPYPRVVKPEGRNRRRTPIPLYERQGTEAAAMLHMPRRAYGEDMP